MIYKTVPKLFNPRFEVVSCFLEYQGEILLLFRQPHKSEGSRWGVPAGKIDAGEAVRAAMVRELYEETGVTLDPSQLQRQQRVFVRYPNYDFVYYIFHTALSARPEVVLNPAEHGDYCWQNPLEALNLPLVLDEDACIHLFYPAI